MRFLILNRHAWYDGVAASWISDHVTDDCPAAYRRCRRSSNTARLVRRLDNDLSILCVPGSAFYDSD